MALIVRIDVDRPYGREPLLRHVLSRLGSDIYFPRIATFGYLRELEVILKLLNGLKAKAYIFFRRCTLPSQSVLGLISAGGHEIGLHLENSRSFQTFVNEKSMLERHVGKPVTAFSKHGSGGERYGLHHYAPYEADKYVVWAQKCGMRLFLGNLEDPTIRPSNDAGFRAFPSAFWLEPAWRNTREFPIDWLLTRATALDIVLLFHPENILADPPLFEDLKRLLTSLDSRILE